VRGRRRPRSARVRSLDGDFSQALTVGASGGYTREHKTERFVEIAMIYLKWTRSELATLEMDALYTEVDDDGWVQREVGIASDGLVIHQLTPTTGRPGWFGLARLSALMLSSNVTKREFEAFWDAGTIRPSRP